MIFIVDCLNFLMYFTLDFFKSILIKQSRAGFNVDEFLLIHINLFLAKNYCIINEDINFCNIRL